MAKNNHNKKKDYFKENLHNIITDKNFISPDAKFTMLRLGLKNYFGTFKPFNKTGRFCYFEEKVDKNSVSGTFEGQDKDSLTIAIDHDFITTAYSSIIFIHLFFEHYLNHILYKINPILLYGKLNKEIDLVNAIANKWDKIPQNSDKTIDFGHKLTRLLSLIENDSIISNEFKVHTKYHFILNFKDALEQLSYQRNEIIHLGDKILARYAYELLMINYVIPIINKVFEIEENTLALNRKTHCNVNVIKELSDIRLEESPFDNPNLANNRLKKINHLKELGRASLENPLQMFEAGGDINCRNRIEEKINKPLRDLAICEAWLRITSGKGHKIRTCPCCGTVSLLTFGISRYSDNSLSVEMAKCFLCSYSINKDIGEPNEFGIQCEQLFEEIK